MLEDLLERADIQMGGSRPWDIRPMHDDIAERILTNGNLRLGESYMAGAWECDRLDQMFERVMRARLHRRVRPIALFPHARRAMLLNRQKGEKAWEVGGVYYDLGNDFHEAMLDPRMTHSRGYWAHAGAW